MALGGEGHDPPHSATRHAQTVDGIARQSSTVPPGSDCIIDSPTSHFDGRRGTVVRAIDGDVLVQLDGEERPLRFGSQVIRVWDPMQQSTIGLDLPGRVDRSEPVSVGVSAPSSARALIVMTTPITTTTTNDGGADADD